jgi:hypothetical protein
MGISRHEFLYEIRMWEARRIIRGYRRRRILQYQLQRMQVWASMFCMGNPNKVAPNDIFHLYFDDDDDERSAGISDDDAARLQAEMAAINKANRRKSKKRKK